MRLLASEIAAATGGRLHGDDVMCEGASIDSRTIDAGALFVPIVAERDGHDFIPGAVASGAAAYMTQREPVGGTAIVVTATDRALSALGAEARRRHGGPVIGITGSVGKTSVKDLTRSAIGAQRRCHASEKSFNNELGVPLTMINAPEGTEVLVVEMGARGIGHIAELCAIAKPTIGIVTWVGGVHTSEFGSIEAVARAKGELIQALPDDGTAILNAECQPVADMASLTNAMVVTYGDTGDVYARGVQLDEELHPRFDAVIGRVVQPVRLAVHGVHNVSNALAALAAAAAVGVAPEAAASGLALAKLSPWRMQLERSPSGALIINDAYNANALSTAAALRSLAALPAERRVAVLGVMAELGDRHVGDHRAMAALCDELAIELIAFGEPAYGVESCTDFDAVLATLGPLGGGDAVLVKGSRVAGLERLATLLVGRGPQTR